MAKSAFPRATAFFPQDYKKMSFVIRPFGQCHVKRNVSVVAIKYDAIFEGNLLCLGQNVAVVAVKFNNLRPPLAFHSWVNRDLLLWVNFPLDDRHEAPCFFL